MQKLTDQFLNAARSDPMMALTAACLYIELLEHRCVSAGYVRAKPLTEARYPKVQIPPIDDAWPDPVVKEHT